MSNEITPTATERTSDIKNVQNFHQQVETIRAEHIKHVTDDEAAGIARGHLGKSLAAGKRPELVEVARRIARNLAAHGPITMDDVTLELRKSGEEATTVTERSGRRNWKGSVFSTSEWVCVGTRPSRIPVNHGRAIKLWALKSWLQKNSLNGTAAKGSSFYTAGIFSQLSRRIGPTRSRDLRWRIGTQDLGAQLQYEIESGNKRLYDVPVELVDNAVGAILERVYDKDSFVVHVKKLPDVKLSDATDHSTLINNGVLYVHQRDADGNHVLIPLPHVDGTGRYSTSIQQLNYSRTDAENTIVTPVTLYY